MPLLCVADADFRPHSVSAVAENSSVAVNSMCLHPADESNHSIECEWGPVV